MRSFAMILLIVGAMVPQSNSSVANCSRTQNASCYKELVVCFQAWKAENDHATVQLAEIIDVALVCRFDSLALVMRNTETNPVMRKHLDLKMLNHALAMGQLEDAAEMVDRIPNPDEGRAQIAAIYAMRGEFNKSAGIVRQITSPGICGTEWFRIAALASDSDRILSDLAMGQGAESLKLVEPTVKGQITRTLAQCVVAQVKRSPNKSTLQTANQVCGDRHDDLREGVYEELLTHFSKCADNVHYEQLIGELLKQDDEPEKVSLNPYSSLDDSVRRTLDGLGASLVRAGADVEKTLPAILFRFRFDRSYSERLSEHSDTELAQNLAAAIAAADADKAFSDKIYFSAINEFAQRGQFSSAFALVPHLHKREDALIRIASCALMKGKRNVAADAVRQWESSFPTFNEQVFEYPVHQELIPVLVALKEKPILDRMISASQSWEQILIDARVASDKGGLNMVEASGKLNAIISMAEALAGLNRCEAAEQLILSVSDKLETIQLGTLQANLASRLADRVVESLGIAIATAMVKPEAHPAVRRALINKICFEYGSGEMESSADAFLTSVATPGEAVSGRLSLVQGILRGKVFQK